MCEYCETVYYENDSGRKFGKLFEKELDYTGDIQLSWMEDNGVKTGYELFMDDDAACTDLSVPVDFCPKCGRNLNPHKLVLIDSLTEWIPVEERLPDESDYYCVTTEDNITDERIEQTIWFAHKDDYDIEESEWRELADYEKVIAWRKSDPYSPGN